MKIGLSSASFYPEVNTEDSIKLMTDIGFNSGEIFLNTPSEYEEEFIYKLLEEKNKYKFDITSIHCCSSQYEPFIFDKYKRRREDMLVYYKKLCKAAKLLGASCYTFHGMKFADINTIDRKFITEIYDELSYISLEQGIKLAQENVSWCISSNLEFIKLLNEECKYPVYYTLDIKQAYKAFIEPEKYIEAIRQYKPKAVGISCLLTTCFDNIKNCIAEIEAAGLRNDLKILVGGGPVDEATGKYVKADHICRDAQQTVEYCKKYLTA
jgi:sugar phosphate isomerase/epimerase